MSLIRKIGLNSGFALRKLYRGLVFLILFTALTASAGAVDVKYAQGFEVDKRAEFTLVEVYAGSGGESLRYLLVPEERFEDPALREEIEEQFPSLPAQQIISVPVKNAVLLSTTFVPPFEYFQALDSIGGVDQIKYLYDMELRKRLYAAGVFEVGNGPTLDLERLVAAGPDIVMANAVEGEWNVIPKLKRAGIPVVVNSDYLETSPLGRAEWMKFIALFLGKYEEAEKRFTATEARYLSLRDRAGRSENRPEVLLNTPMSGTWVVPGGDGYMAQFIEDAHGKYLWADSSGYKSLFLDVETVFSKAKSADIWLHQYGWTSRRDVLQSDSRFSNLKAFQNEEVVNNDARMNEHGGNDFYENGPYQPDLILKDLIAVFHPELFPAHELYFYRYLR